MKTLVPTALVAIALSTAAVSTAEAAEGWARSSGVLRAGPASSYPSVGRVHAGEDLIVHGCLRRWSWCDVSVEGDRGWFPGRRIALESNGRRVELPAAAAIIGLGVLGFERDLYWSEHYRDRSFRPVGGRGSDRAAPPPSARSVPRDETRQSHVRPPVASTRPVAPAAPGQAVRPRHQPRAEPPHGAHPSAPGACNDAGCR